MVYEGIYLYILVYTQIFRFRDNICKDMMYIEVYLQDSPTCPAAPALTAYKVGGVDWGEHAGGAGLS